MFLLNRIALYEFIKLTISSLHLSRMHGVLLSLHRPPLFENKKKQKEKRSHIDAYSKKKESKYPKYNKPRKMLPSQRRNKENLYLLSEVDFFFSRLR